MSGRATGWVLTHGPTAQQYGIEKARAMRLVLIAIADAANAVGEHAHPGMEAIVTASLYTPGYVRKVIARLVGDGWLAVEEEGGGRGRATSYRLPKMAEKPAPLENRDPEERVSENARLGALKRAPQSEKRAPDTPPDQPLFDTNGLYNGKTLNGATREAAQHLTVFAFEQRPKPVARGGFPAVKGIIAAVLDAEYGEDEMRSLIAGGPVTWTLAGVTTALNRRRETAQRRNGRAADGAWPEEVSAWG